MRILRAFAVLVAVAGVGAVPAHATLFDGETVRLTYEFPALGGIVDTRTFVVGAGVEAPAFPTPLPITNIDFSDTNIYVTYNSTATWRSTSFNGFHVFDLLGTIPAFLSVTIDPATNMTGFDASRISFDGNNIWVNWQGLSFDTATIVSLDVAPVPEPSTLALTGLGIPGLIRAARRRR